MSRKKGQTFTAEQKTKIVLELLKEEKTAAQLAGQHKVTTQTLGQWKKKFLENTSLAFEPAKAVQEFKKYFLNHQYHIFLFCILSAYL
jgi:putative transposase